MTAELVWNVTSLEDITQDPLHAINKLTVYP